MNDFEFASPLSAAEFFIFSPACEVQQDAKRFVEIELEGVLRGVDVIGVVRDGQ